jgi:hypothetical protein
MQICIIYHFIKNTSPQRISHLKVMNSTDRNIQLPRDRWPPTNLKILKAFILVEM